jgi:hypothetical protein
VRDRERRRIDLDGGLAPFQECYKDEKLLTLGSPIPQVRLLNSVVMAQPLRFVAPPVLPPTQGPVPETFESRLVGAQCLVWAMVFEAGVAIVVWLWW